ncbi:DsbA family oxidoreductase [Planococcus shenhongbingii]|uniref:DsbA family oxidoreductase n=1 Tax=Planococcus shenhongbingii TaxID=3058398 RepID=UPI00262B612B|nr:DsbA family oxidoreductase [Planococcus sp. N016]WKA56944.1 DsbA family oxidoreductase [Planococcus sp. N016]
MALKVKVYSDYVCPFCFLAEQPLAEAIKNKDIEVEWMPFELRPAPNPTLRPEDDYLQTTWAQSVFPMAESMGIDIVLPDVSPQPHTHLAFEGYQYAKENGKAAAYNERLLKAFFQEGLDIGDSEILTKLAGEVGLDEQQYREALKFRKYKEAHQLALKQAEEAGITAVPTFVIGEMAVSGIQSKEKIEQIIEDELGKQKPKVLFEGMACGPGGFC